SPFALTNLGSVKPRSDRTFRATFPSSTTPAPAGTQDFISINGTPFAAAFPHRDFPTPYSENQFRIRGDANITNRDSLIGQYLYQKGDNINGLGGTGGFTGDIPFISKKLSSEYTRQISSRSVNNFRFNYTKLDVLFGGGCSGPLTGCIPDPKDIDK